ncbi:MAG: sigma-70 family RNA polymerase sigma factor [Gemmataceae bacterium]
MTPTARLARLLPPDARPDGALLAAFLADREEAAFAELVRRHGPLVLAACRRLLPDPADVDDAFQASFLVLVRRARRLTGAAALGPWLYRVAAWTARNARRRNARRLARTAPLADAAAPPTSPAAALDLDAALLALPEKYRAPLVLCHLQGWSRRDAAERLGCREGTLSSLLARGLTKLKARLPGYESAPAVAVVPAALAAATVSAARAAELASPAVAQLADAVLRALWVPKATAAGLALVFALGAGVGLSVREAPAVAQVPTAPATRPAPARVIDPEEFNLRQVEADLVETRWHLKATQAARDAAAQAWAEAALTLRELPANAPPDERERWAQKERETARRYREEHARYFPLRAREEALEQFVARMSVRLDARRGLPPPEVTATLAVDVTFPEAGRYHVGLAARLLVEDATDSSDGAGGADDVWNAARRLPHVHVRYPAPRRTVRVADAPDIAVAEVLVPLPLTRAPGGYVLVRDGDRVVRFSKYPHAAATRFQEAIGAAVPAGR